MTALPGRVPAVGSWDSTEVRRSPAPVTTLAGTEGGRARLLRRDLVDTIACEVALTAKAIGGDVVIDSHRETSRHE